MAECAVCSRYKHPCESPCKMSQFFHSGNMSILESILSEIPFSVIKNSLNSLSDSEAFAWIGANIPEKPSGVAEKVSELTAVKNKYSHGLQCSTFYVEVVVQKVVNVLWMFLCGSCHKLGSGDPGDICASCDSSDPWEIRCAVRLLVSDSSDTLIVSAFNGVAAKMLSKTASELVDVHEMGVHAYNAVFNSLVGKHYKLMVSVMSTLLERDFPQPVAEILTFDLIPDQTDRNAGFIPKTTVAVAVSRENLPPVLTCVLRSLEIPENYKDVLSAGSGKKLKGRKKEFGDAKKAVFDVLNQLRKLKSEYERYVGYLDKNEEDSSGYVILMQEVRDKFLGLVEELDNSLEKARAVLVAVRAELGLEIV